MKKIFLLLFLSYCLFLSAGKPLFRAGIMSDTHVTSAPESCSILKDALELFKEHNVDLIINAGDIADVYNIQAYKNYRNTVNAVYPEKMNKPRELFAYAYHDIIGHKGKSPFDAFKDVKKYLEIEHDPYDIVTHKGYTFVIIPQYHEVKRYKEFLDKAANAGGNKPFFIIDHVPLHNTVIKSLNGNSAARKLVDNYPSAIHISGHNHSLLTNEKNIWQGDFTAVNAGYIHGSMRVKKTCDVVMIMDVFKHKIVFRRFFADSRKQYRADSPWIIPLPFDKKSAPYSAENRLKRSPVPAFSAGGVEAVTDGKGVKVTFPHAYPAEDIYEYRLELQKKEQGNWRTFAHKSVSGPFVNGAEKLAPYNFADFSFGYFETNESYQVKIVPVHFSGKTGKALKQEFVIRNKPAAEIIFESHDPMRECRNSYGYIGKISDRQHKLAQDGFFHIKEERISTRLYFPEYVWNKKDRARFIFDIDIYQAHDRSSILEMRNSNPANIPYVPGRVTTQPGNSRNIRYVIDTSLERHHGSILFFYTKGGGVGKIKINYIRIERY